MWWKKIDLPGKMESPPAILIEQSLFIKMAQHLNMIKPLQLSPEGLVKKRHLYLGGLAEMTTNQLALTKAPEDLVQLIQHQTNPKLSIQF